MINADISMLEEEWLETIEKLRYNVKFMIKLNDIELGEGAQVVQVAGEDAMHNHLESMGFVPGECVKVVSSFHGSLIVEITDCQIGMDADVASKIFCK